MKSITNYMLFSGMCCMQNLKCISMFMYMYVPPKHLTTILSIPSMHSWNRGLQISNPHGIYVTNADTNLH